MISKRIKFIFLASIAVFLLGVGWKIPSVEAASNGGGFTYKVNFPDNQMKENIGYYHLKVKPEDKQTVTITMANTAEKPIVVNVSLNGAKTNSNGVIEYGDNGIKNDKSLKYPFEKVVKGPKKVELKAREEKEVEFNITMPETSYEGVITGGIQMIQAGQGEDQLKKSGSVVVNEYAYVVGMQLQEDDKKIKPKLKLNSVKAG